MKTLLCVIILLFATPTLAATCLAFFDPKHWGGEPTVPGILMMAIFGVLTVPMWLTYLPTLVLTPMAMNRMASNEKFHSMPLWELLLFAVMIGAVIGIFIMSPMILRSLGSPLKLIVNLIGAGSISGAISYTAITMLYKL
jgi:hypothetical protein